MRQGSHVDIRLERFEEALHDPAFRLTYTALSGVHTQSVEDVEQQFITSVIQWMESKAYTSKAQYLSVVQNWRRSCNERGFTEEERRAFNGEFLAYILDDLMPWHRQGRLKRFSLLEVNRFYLIIVFVAFCSLRVYILQTNCWNKRI